MQHTTCSIKTEEIVAKAQSTASRILTGVCTSGTYFLLFSNLLGIVYSVNECNIVFVNVTEEMTKAFKSLEKQFFERLDEVQQNLIAIIQSKMQPVAPRKIYKSPKPSPFKTIDYSFDDEMFKNYT